jgi:putative methionine-R-sulfoxide reductase with GAF domain
MKQLAVNLLHNASKFTPEGAQVWVSLEDENVSVRIVVEDNGIGIPEDEVDKIFDHFHQADNTSTREYGGSGLGLAICKNIVDWHDGKIWVENVPGRGARFIAVIPKKQAMVRSHVLNAHGTMRRYEVERYLELIVEMVAELMNVRKASLMMLDRAEGELRIDCAIGLDEEIVEHARLKLGEGIAGRVAQDNRSYLVQDIESDDRVDAKNNDYLYDSKSFLSVPISREGRVHGVINVANPTWKPQFDWDDCRLLETFAARVAMALERLRDFTDTYADFESVRATLKSMLDAKRYVDDLSEGVMTDVLSGLAEKLRLSAEETASLQYAFNVYDLGLARIGYNIIKQPREMTNKDRNSIEQHPVIGTEMLRHIEYSPDVNDAVLYHHENYDGTGYPAGLSGDEIPLNARIIRIADTFRALVSHRPYQKQYTPREAIEVVRHRSGTLFDPELVEAFVDVASKHVDRLEAAAPRNRVAPLVELDSIGLNDETSL